MPMNKRTILKVAVSGMAIIGLLLLLMPFLSSLNINPKQENNAWAACNVSEIQKGSLKKCGWSVVYRRTDKDIESVDKFITLLADPNSEQSKQPLSAQNKWRSEDKEYFIFKPYAPKRHCGVKLINSKNHYRWEPPEHAALVELPYFTEPCEGRTWDMSGRLYHREGYPQERNLIVPKVNWVSQTKVLIYGR